MIRLCPRDARTQDPLRLLEVVSSGRQPHVRGNHDGRGPSGSRAWQIVNVLGDAAEMWIVELRDERDRMSCIPLRGHA